MRRTPELDALRGLASLSIVVYHTWFPGSSALASAVNLFFVMSGYLITSLILQNLDADNFFTAFYARRALRLWPIYYLSLAAVVAFNAASPARESVAALPYYLTYTQHVQAYWGAPRPEFITAFRHTWSLAIEEQFYIIWPVLLYACGRRSVAPLAAVFVALPLAARALGVFPWLLATQCDGLALGALLAATLAAPGRLERDRPRLERSWLAAAAVALAFSVAGAALVRRLGVGWWPLAASAKVLANNVVFLCVVAALVSRSGAPALKILRGAALVFLGRVSYGLYLYHHILFMTADRLCARYGVARAWWLDLGVVAAAFGVAALSWRFVERPLLGFKGRFEYRRPAAVPAGIPAPPSVRSRGVGALADSPL